MNTTIRTLTAITFGIGLLAAAGCSEDAQQKWEKAGEAVGDAAKETAQEADKAVKEAVKNAKETDPDTGLAK